MVKEAIKSRNPNGAREQIPVGTASVPSIIPGGIEDHDLRSQFLAKDAINVPDETGSGPDRDLYSAA